MISKIKGNANHMTRLTFKQQDCNNKKMTAQILWDRYDEVEYLYKGTDLSARQIAEKLDVKTRCMVIGFCRRHWGARYNYRDSIKAAKPREKKPEPARPKPKPKKTNTKAKPLKAQQLTRTKNEDLNSFTEPQFLPNEGCCKYPVGSGPKYQWCTAKPMEGSVYCEFHHKKCSNGTASIDVKPMQTAYPYTPYKRGI